METFLFLPSRLLPCTKKTITIIQTTRTTLRSINQDDCAFIHALNSLEESNRYNTAGPPKNMEETKATMQSWLEAEKEAKSKVYLVEEIESQQPIGLLGMVFSNPKYNRAELWYKIHPTYWGQGYATEIVKESIRYGFENLNLHRIQAGCAVENIGSIRVLEKAGMIREGGGRKVLPLPSGWSDNFEYAILETDPR